jgi:hypothetical protein
MKHLKMPAIYTIIVLAFVGLAATYLITSKRAEDTLKQQLHSEQIKQRDTQQKLQDEDTQHNKTLEEKQKLEQQNTDQQKKIQELEQQLSVRRENAARLANAVTFTKPASAAANVPAPAGSGCEWLRGQLAAHGITGADQNAAVAISQRESGCTPCKLNGGAINCGYTGNLACNVFQELPCGKWGANAGDVSAHIRGADRYAKERYGGWQGAYSAWLSKHWW